MLQPSKMARRGAGGHTRPRVQCLRQPNSETTGEVGHFCSRELLPSLNVCGLGFHCLGEKALRRRAREGCSKTLVCKRRVERWEQRVSRDKCRKRGQRETRGKSWGRPGGESSRLGAEGEALMRIGKGSRVAQPCAPGPTVRILLEDV